MHKLCYKACIEKCDYCAWLSIVGMHYDGHVYHISKLRAIFSFHCMMPATLTFTEKQQLGAVLTIHKLKLRLASFRPRNTSTRVYSHFHSDIISSDLVDNNAVSFNSQLNGLLTTLGTVYPSLNGLRLSAHLAGITQSGTI